MILSLDDIKNSSIYDPTITDQEYEKYIIQTESLFLKLRGQELYEFEGSAVIGSSEITNLTYYDSVKVRYLDFVDVSSNHFIVTKVKKISDNNYTVFVNGAFDEDYSEFVVYPRNSDSFAFSAIDYLYSGETKKGIKSEEIGDYGYTKDGNIDIFSGLPYEIAGLVERFVQ